MNIDVLRVGLTHWVNNHQVARSLAGYFSDNRYVNLPFVPPRVCAAIKQHTAHSTIVRRGNALIVSSFRRNFDESSSEHLITGSTLLSRMGTLRL